MEQLEKVVVGCCSIVPFSYQQGEGSLASTSVASNDLRKRFEPIIFEIYDGLDKFFEAIKNFQLELESIVAEFSIVMEFIQENLKSKFTDCKDSVDWDLISTYLQRFLESFVYLKSEVIQREIEKTDEVIIKNPHDRKELTYIGTPV